MSIRVTVPCGAGTVSAVDRDQTRRHIEEVSARVRAAAPDDLREELLRVTAVHEDRDDAPLDVAGVVLGLGEVWRLEGETGVGDYIDRHRDHLRPLLLFELAHEGAATGAMYAVAARAGLAEEFGTWERALRAAQQDRPTASG
jgi:hypothetical protein